MKQKKLMMLFSILALVVSSLMIAGNVGAMYMSDGATQNGTTGGWTKPSDGKCVLGMALDGTLIVDNTITNKRDCDARLITRVVAAAGKTGSAICTSTVGNTGSGETGLTSTAAKYAQAGKSTCVTIDASGNVTGSISMKGLDSTEQMCQALGAAQGQTAHLANNAAVTQSQTMCIAYSWVFAGQDATGTPLTFGTKGVDSTVTPNAGFCYASMTTGLAAASCPTVVGTTPSAGTMNSTAAAALGYSVSGSNCNYAYGITGKLSSALTKADGSTYAAASSLDLTTFTTQGACLANGGSWSNWIPDGANATSTAIGSITGLTFNVAKEVVNADQGCLHCHSSSVQYNGPAERWKDSYLMTGHKNMLRRVIPGMAWAGPNGAIYTQDTAGHAIDFVAGTVGGGSLFYIFGDWMATYPNAVGPNGDTTSYSCYACHTTGTSDSLNPGVQSIGTPTYTAAYPAAYGGGYVASVSGGGKWDLEGINCSRCHNATVPQITQAMISASSFPTTAPTGTGMGALASGTGRTNLCFGCHQSIGKSWPAGIAQFDPTLIPAGVSHGAAPGGDFNGHVLGNSFLNSVHARYVGGQSGNGSITLNSLGKYDLTDPNGTSEYRSAFKGYTCWQSPSSNSPAKTKPDGTEIKTKTDCETIYGAGSWRADQDGSLATTSIQGTCTTCHDVHNSLFVTGQSEKAIRKTCTDCHVNNQTITATDSGAPQIDPTKINHPQGAGTPFDTTLFGNDSCVVCHMATQAVSNGYQNSMAAHVWRISTDPNYSTFPSTGQFYGGTCSAHTGAVQNAPYLPVVYLSDASAANCVAAAGTWTATTRDRNAQTAPEYNTNGSVQYPNAVWVDTDMACGQCHGGSYGAGKTQNGAMYMPKFGLASLATGMHGNGNNQSGLSASFTYTNDTGKGYLVHLDASGSSCPAGDTCAYEWSFGDTTTGYSITTTMDKQYTSASTQTVTLTVVDTVTQSRVSAANTVTPVKVNHTPVPGFTSSIGAFTVTLTDASTDADGDPLTVTVYWGDGSTSSGSGGGGQQYPHTYSKAGTYTITYAVYDGTVTTNANALQAVVPVYYSISGKVVKNDGNTAIPFAVVKLYSGATLLKTMYATTTGTYSFTNLAPGNYTLQTTASGYTFANVNVTISSSSLTQTIKAN